MNYTMNLYIKETDYENLNTDEQKIVGDIKFLLSSSYTYAREFKAALELYKILGERSACLQSDLAGINRMATRDVASAEKFKEKARILVQNGSFMSICQRDSIMTLRHIDWLLVHTLRERVKKVGFLSSRINSKTLQAAVDIFQRAFPDIKYLRNAIGHSAEDNRISELRDKQRGEAGPLVINSYGPVFTTTWNGKNYKFSLSEDALKAVTGSLLAVQQALVLYPDERFYVDIANRPFEF